MRWHREHHWTSRWLPGLSWCFVGRTFSMGIIVDSHAVIKKKKMAQTPSYSYPSFQLGNTLENFPKQDSDTVKTQEYFHQHRDMSGCPLTATPISFLSPYTPVTTDRFPVCVILPFKEC